MRSAGSHFGYSYPDVVGDTIYMGDQYDYVYAIDKDTGKLKWKFHEKKVYFTCTSVVDGVVYVGRWTNRIITDKKSYIYAIDAANGKLKWRSEIGSPSGMIGSPTAVDGTVYIGSSDNHLYAVDTSSGKIKWSFKTVNFIVATPLVSDGVVYIISKNNLYAIDAKNGELKWQYKTGSEYFASYSIVGDMVYVGSL